MNNEQKILNLLGLARRANQLISGEGMVIDAIRKGTPHLVIVAEDASENTKKKLSDKSHYYRIPIVFFADSLCLSQAIGQKRSVIAICDAGFANKIKQLLNF